MDQAMARQSRRDRCIIYGLRKSTAKSAQEIQAIIWTLVDDLGRRYGLDVERDPNDTICSKIIALRKGVNQLATDVYKVDGEKETPESLHTINFQHLVLSVLEKLTPLIELKDLEIQAHFESDIPNIQTFDEDLRQIVTEVIFEAIAASERGEGIDVTIEQQGEDIIFTVGDNDTLELSSVRKEDDRTALKPTELVEQGETNARIVELSFVNDLVRDAGMQLSVSAKDNDTCVKVTVIPL
ncbi:MAG: ATP-binding protein [Patescibacteria group bacterium]